MEILVLAVIVSFYWRQGKSGIITTDRMEPGDIGALVEAPGGGGDYGGTYGWDWEDSPGPKVLARLGKGGLSTGSV